MVRSRIGTQLAFADTDSPPGTDPQASDARTTATSLGDAEAGFAPSKESAPPSGEARPPASENAADADRGDTAERERNGGPFALVLEIIAPWFGRAARSIGLGCLLSLGCGTAQSIEVEGVVRDGRTGEPIAGAQITTEDGRTLETDDEGRFVVSAREGERVVARARGRCDASAKVEPATGLTLSSMERLEVPAGVVEAGLDTEMRIEVRTPCDPGASLRWQQISGPTLGPQHLRLEEHGRVVVLRTLSDMPGRRDYELEVSSLLDGAAQRRVVRVSAGVSPTGACEATRRAWGMGACGADAGTCETGCASCHADTERVDAERLTEEVLEWELSAMSAAHAQGADLAVSDDETRASTCSDCAPGASAVAPIACGTCHAPSDDEARPLRLLDTVFDAGFDAALDRAFGGALAPHGGAAELGVQSGALEHLGSGAVCASCHRLSPDASREAAPRAPQADVLLGRGARLTTSIDGGSHRFIVDTCVRCHMARPPEGHALRGLAGGHTLSMRALEGEPRFNDAACAACHGEVAVDRIGTRDWNADGRVSRLAEEYASALDLAGARLRERIAALRLRDACAAPHVAYEVVEQHGALVLADTRGVLLGDCDASGAFDASETHYGIDALPRALADAAYDLHLVRSDGSAGAHNPAYTFAGLSAVSRGLR
jgi:hypothetical protein